MNASSTFSDISSHSGESTFLVCLDEKCNYRWAIMMIEIVQVRGLARDRMIYIEVRTGSPEGSTDTELDGLGGPLEDHFVEEEAENERENYDENEDENEEEEDPQGSQDDVNRQDKALLQRPGSLPSQAGKTTEAYDNGRGPTSHPNPSLTESSISPPGLHRLGPHSSIRPEIITAPVYDIVPTIAAPHATSINAATATPDLRWVFSGGADGYIRKFNWAETTVGKSMLTVAQKHPFVDSVIKAGVLLSYWENENSSSKPTADNSTPSPVYSLAVHSDGLWLLSGTESGGINLQSIRHDEGKQIACLKQHTSAVSVLKLARDERSVLSGSWDKTIIDWDLDTGKAKRNFEGGSGQIAGLEVRPLSSVSIPQAPAEAPLPNETLTSDNNNAPRLNGTSSEGNAKESSATMDQPGLEDAAGSPADSLFNGNDNDSLFGDNDDNDATALFGGGNEDIDFSTATVNDMDTTAPPQTNGDVGMTDGTHSGLTALASGGESITLTTAEHRNSQGPEKAQEGPELKTTDTFELLNGEASEQNAAQKPNEAPDLPQDESTFLAASIDGSIRLWDKRQRQPAAKIVPRNVPPWCMSACWSPDGNFIYAGRRSGTVEEYSLHKGLQGAERSLKLPSDSGAVSAVHCMPNGRHLVCASFDILRLYDLQQQQMFKHSTVPFLIIPGHRTGVVSQLYIDPSCRYLITTGGNRGWEGISTEVLLGYEIHVGK